MTFKETILANRRRLFASTNWNDWKFQLRNRVKGMELGDYFLLTESEKKGILGSKRLNTGATPYYISLADPFNPCCPIRRLIVPDENETIISPEESSDPLSEEMLSPVKGLTHMYPDRVLLFTNHECPVYCRHCMRGRKVSDSSQRMTLDDLELSMKYIELHPEIEDVVISGGDPLILSDNKLDIILDRLNKIPHVKICRIGSRVPVTLPSRITNSLCALLEKHNNDNLSIFCNTHFNHAKECTLEAKNAILQLLKAGINVGNQCVILKDLNDSGVIMLELHKKLLEMRVRAYYMYDPELIYGSRGFRTPLYKGIEIIEYMRGKISGMGIPHYVSDLPGGGGKVTMTPEWYLGFDEESRKHFFKSPITGKIHESFEPIGSDTSHYKKIKNKMHISMNEKKQLCDFTQNKN